MMMKWATSSWLMCTYLMHRVFNVDLDEMLELRACVDVSHLVSKYLKFTQQEFMSTYDNPMTQKASGKNTHLQIQAMQHLRLSVLGRAC